MVKKKKVVQSPLTLPISFSDYMKDACQTVSLSWTMHQFMVEKILIELSITRRNQPKKLKSNFFQNTLQCSTQSSLFSTSSKLNSNIKTFKARKILHKQSIWLLNRKSLQKLHKNASPIVKKFTKHVEICNL